MNDTPYFTPSLNSFSVLSPLDTARNFIENVESQVGFPIVGVVLTVAAVVTLFFIWWLMRNAGLKRLKEKKESEYVSNEARRVMEEARRDAFERRLAPNGDFIRAALRWRITVSGERRKELGLQDNSLLGGLGLTNPDGRDHGAVDLQRVSVYALTEDEDVTRIPNPVPFRAVWKYVPEKGDTELIIEDTGGIQIKDDLPDDCRDLLSWDDKEDVCLRCYGVSAKHPSGKVTVTAPGMTVEFYLEHYTDNPPFYL